MMASKQITSPSREVVDNGSSNYELNRVLKNAKRQLAELREYKAMRQARNVMPDKQGSHSGSAADKRNGFH